MPEQRIGSTPAEDIVDFLRRATGVTVEIDADRLACALAEISAEFQHRPPVVREALLAGMRGLGSRAFTVSVVPVERSHRISIAASPALMALVNSLRDRPDAAACAGNRSPLPCPSPSSAGANISPDRSRDMATTCSRERVEIDELKFLSDELMPVKVDDDLMRRFEALSVAPLVLRPRRHWCVRVWHRSSGWIPGTVEWKFRRWMRERQLTVGGDVEA